MTSRGGTLCGAELCGSGCRWKFRLIPVVVTQCLLMLRRNISRGVGVVGTGWGRGRGDGGGGGVVGGGGGRGMGGEGGGGGGFTGSLG